MSGELARMRAVVSDPQVLLLAVLLLLAAGALYAFGFQLLPFIAAFLIAYALDGAVQQLTRRGWRRVWAVVLIYLIYLLLYVGLLAGPMQLVARRAVEAARTLPSSPDQLIERFSHWPDLSFGLMPENLRQDLLNLVLEQTQQGLGQLVSGSLGLLPQVTGWIVFVFLVPLLVFFFLKDKESLGRTARTYLPLRHELLSVILREMESRMGQYVRSKICEILLVGSFTWAAFALLGFEYPVVYGLVSGLSVLVPFVGMVAVAVPLFIQGYLQWGMTLELGWLMLAYSVIQFVDGNILVPVMFSQAVALHPITILLAVILFGNLWGFWGVLLAIPMATFVKTLLHALIEREAAAHAADLSQ